VADVRLVVSQPDRPAGRGRRVDSTPVKDAAAEMGIEVIQPGRIKDPGFIERLERVGARLFFVTAYGRILPGSVLDIPASGCVNLHASLLPRHRGAAPIPWAILRGDAETGLSLMLMDEGMDTGPVIATWSTPIGEDETAGALADRLAEASEGFVQGELPRYLAGELAPVEQPSEGATMAPRLSKTDGSVDWSRPAAQVARQVRAVTPWPGATTCIGERQVRIHAVRLPGEGEEPPPDAEAGTLFCGQGRMCVRCGEGWLLIVMIQSAGKRCLEAGEFLRGSRLGPCTLLTRTPRP
jgi:methionyl-tRNA formyltransferase